LIVFKRDSLKRVFKHSFTESFKCKLQVTMDRHSVFFFDGDCGFCNSVVRIALNLLDEETEIFFAPLQGLEAGKSKKMYAEFPSGLEQVVFLDKEVLYSASQAFFKLCKYFRWPYKYLYFLSLLPRVVSDYFYFAIARRRRLLSRGEMASCELMKPEQIARFLD